MMKRITVLLLTISTILCLTSGSSRAQQSPANSLRLPAERKVLIVYLSRTNNTKAIAEMIQQKVGGKLVGLELETPYPADYHTTVQQVVRENETGYLPPLKTKIERIEQYDVVFLAFRLGACSYRLPLRVSCTSTTLRGRRLSHSTRMADTA